jgi:hypothetical protein
MSKKLFNPIVIIKSDDPPINPPVGVNSMVDCHMGEPGVFITTCGC